MGSSRASDVRRVQVTYDRGGTGGYQDGQGAARPKWLWGWVTVYVLLALLAILLIGLWVGNSGGAQWANSMKPNLMFNLHPLFMVLGFVVIIGHTNLIYRLWPDGNITWLKWSHMLLQLTGWILMVLGAYAVGYSKDYTAINSGTNVPAQHFVSTHSWIGLTILIIITFQWVCGFFGLLWPGCSGERRGSYRGAHIFTGNVIFLLGCAQVLIGIDQLKATVTTNVLALTIAGYAILGGYLLSTNSFKKGHAQHPDVRSTNDEERQPLTRAAYTSS